MRRGGLLAPAPPWSRSRAWLSVGWRGSPRRRAGSLPWPWPPPSVGRALRCLSWRCRAALRRGGGVLLAPLRPWAGATPSPWHLRQLLPLPPDPLPPRWGGGGKRGITGRKIVTQETQEGCLSFSIKVFQNFLSAEKLAKAVEKNFSTALGLPLCERESFCVLASRGGKWYDSHVFFVEFGACHEKTGRWNIGPCVS